MVSTIKKSIVLLSVISGIFIFMQLKYDLIDNLLLRTVITEKQNEKILSEAGCNSLKAAYLIWLEKYYYFDDRTKEYTLRTDIDRLQRNKLSKNMCLFLYPNIKTFILYSLLLIELFFLLIFFIFVKNKSLFDFLLFSVFFLLTIFLLGIGAMLINVSWP